MQKNTKLTFDIDPYQGAAAALSRLHPEGMRLIKIERKGTKAVCTYEPALNETLEE